VVAGALLFVHPGVVHCQYLASNAPGRRVSALDAVLESAIANAVQAGARWFDFGTSTEDEGRHLNPGLYDYKRSFGAGSTLHEFHTLDLGPFR
jgi:lipid II:glycine glycyltransferase (peptidoglycan interpeptide bridge formation enzyme)